jgi:hypothetical protein
LKGRDTTLVIFSKKRYNPLPVEGKRYHPTGFLFKGWYLFSSKGVISFFQTGKRTKGYVSFIMQKKRDKKRFLFFLIVTLWVTINISALACARFLFLLFLHLLFLPLPARDKGQGTRDKG